MRWQVASLPMLRIMYLVAFLLVIFIVAVSSMPKKRQRECRHWQAILPSEARAEL